MLHDRVLAHYSALGWRLADATTVGGPGVAFHPDLVLAKEGTVLAVRISEEALGTYQIGLFGARCKRANAKGLVVCASSPELLEACENARVDFLDAETVGEPIVVPVSRPRPIQVAPVAQKPLMYFQQFTKAETHVRWWRWAVVAVIWVAAIVATTYWLTLAF